MSTHIWHVAYRLEPGNANLPIGGLRDANREIGVPGKTYLFKGIFNSEESRWGSNGLQAKKRSPTLIVGTFLRPSFTWNTRSSASTSSSIFTSTKFTPRSFRNCLARRQSTHQLVPYIVISSIRNLMLALPEGFPGALSGTLAPMR